MATLPDGRVVPPPHADEKVTLVTWLDFHRATLEVKSSGLKDDQVRQASAPPSRMTLLGLVQHLAEIERNWFQRIFAGKDVPPVYGADNEDGFTLDPDRGIDEALAIWRAEADLSRELIAGASLEESGRLSVLEAGFAGSDTVSLRWILVHVIEEYARHNGHADLLRERIDGSTGP